MSNADDGSGILIEHFGQEHDVGKVAEQSHD